MYIMWSEYTEKNEKKKMNRASAYQNGMQLEKRLEKNL